MEKTENKRNQIKLKNFNIENLIFERESKGGISLLYEYSENCRDELRIVLPNCECPFGVSYFFEKFCLSVVVNEDMEKVFNEIKEKIESNFNLNYHHPIKQSEKYKPSLKIKIDHVHNEEEDYFDSYIFDENKVNLNLSPTNYEKVLRPFDVCKVLIYIPSLWKFTNRCGLHIYLDQALLKKREDRRSFQDVNFKKLLIESDSEDE